MMWPARKTRIAISEGVRLQKVLSAAGVASRRKAEELIRAGRVKVDGIVVRELGTRIDPERAVVHVDGNRVVLSENQVYLAVNKMPGVLSTMSDDRGRPHIGELVDRPVGAAVPRRPARHGLRGPDPADQRRRAGAPADPSVLRGQQDLHGGDPRTGAAGPRSPAQGRAWSWTTGPAKVDSFDVVDVHHQRAVVEVVLHEGRKHIVRRLLDAVDHPVSRLVRTKIGDVQLGHQRPGTVRKLSPVEIAQLYRAVGL